jgi:hypothetical protein
MRRFLGFLLPLFLIGCSSRSGSLLGISQMVGSAGGKVVSADGDLTLDIPVGALAEDTEISVRKISRSELGPDFQGVDVAAAYELGPDGLAFLQPVTVTLRLDQSPLGTGDVLQADAVVLVSESGTEVEAAGSQVLAADADTGETTLTGEIEHFSGLVAVKGGVRFEASGVPRSMQVGFIFNADLDLTVAQDARISGTVSFFSTSEPETLYDNSPIPDDFTLSPGQSLSVLDGPFSCIGAGLGRFIGVANFDDHLLTLERRVVTVHEFEIRVSTGISHTTAAGEERTHPLPATLLEAMALAYVGDFPGMTANDPVVTVGGKDAWLMVDHSTGEVVESLSTPAGQTYGAVPLADGGVSAVFAYGEWGAAVWYWVAGAFGAPVMLSTNHITDALAIPGGGLIFSDNTAGQIRFLEFVANAYVVSAIVMNLPGVISATQLADGSILAVTGGAGGALYAAASRDASLLLVAQIADTLRRVRALGDVAAISYYGGGVGFGGISVAARNAGVWALVFGLIGTSSIGIDLKQPSSDFAEAITSDHIFIAATSYNTNEYRIIEVEADGSYWADTLFALPEACEAPGHALWLPDTNELAITCHDSNTLTVIPVTTD